MGEKCGHARRCCMRPAEKATLKMRAHKRQDPAFEGGVLVYVRSLTITYFHTGNPHYHRRGVVSRSCSGWEGVVPTRYGHQA